MCFEVLSSTEWQVPFSNNVFFPTWYEDITNTFSSKINALKCYEDELKKWPHPRSLEAVESCREAHQQALIWQKHLLWSEK